MIDPTLLTATTEQLDVLLVRLTESGIMEEFKSTKHALSRMLVAINKEMPHVIFQSSIKHSERTGKATQIAQFVLDNNTNIEATTKVVSFFSDGVSLNDNAVCWNIPLQDYQTPETDAYCASLLVVVDPIAGTLLLRSYVFSVFDGSGETRYVVEDDESLFYYELIRSSRKTRTGNTLSVQIRI